MPPLSGERISRLQLRFEPAPDGRLSVENLGRRPLVINGRVVQGGLLKPGDTVGLQNALLLFVTKRRPKLGLVKGAESIPEFPFGQADPYGIVGESPTAWALRSALSFAAKSQSHVLVQGESGTGKELAARAIHSFSGRSTGPFVSRNASTLPEGLIDAELFGSTKNYPNAGSPERLGLIGEANGGTLFLDEIGELSPHLQAHLLRVLDRRGEYQRLGESRTRRSDLRLIAATNRPLDALKHDFAARFAIRVTVPALADRREDIPLLVSHLLAAAASSNTTLSDRFFERRGGALAEPRVAPELVLALLDHGYTHHLRELERYLWLSLATSPENFLSFTPELAAEMRKGAAAPEPPASEPVTDPPSAPPAEERTIRREDIAAALEEAGGNVTEAARRLGLKNRFALYRLMKEHNMAVVRDGRD